VILIDERLSTSYPLRVRLLGKKGTLADLSREKHMTRMGTKPLISRRGLMKFGAAASAMSTFRISTTALAADAITMRVGSDSPPGDQHTIALEKFKEIVEAKAGGRISVKIFPSAQLGDNVSMNNAIKAGTLDANFTDVGVLSVGAPKIDVVSLPFLFESREAALRALYGELGSALKPDIEQAFQARIFGWGSDGLRNMWNGRRPIHSVADVKGLKMRVQASQLQKDMYSALGALPTPIAFPEVYTALQTKVVDGADLPVADMISMKFYQVTKYLTLTRHVPILDAFIVSSKFLTKLSPTDADIVAEAGRAASDHQAKVDADEEARTITDLKSKGIEIIETVDRESFIDAVAPVYDTAINRFGGSKLIELAKQGR
jgi:TRAP-type transport system periplasmic protein